MGADGGVADVDEVERVEGMLAVLDAAVFIAMYGKGRLLNVAMALEVVVLHVLSH